MADPRADVPILEQPRRRWRRVALIAAVLAGSAGIVALLWPRRERVEGHAFAIPSRERRIVVEVLNGTGRQGLARAATRMLRKRGVDVVFLGNADGPADSTRVLVRRGEPERAQVVAEGLGLGQVILARDTLRRVDASVILGGDFRPKDELHP